MKIVFLEDDDDDDDDIEGKIKMRPEFSLKQQ